MQVMRVCESSLMIHSVQRNRKQGHEQKMKMGDEWVFEDRGEDTKCYLGEWENTRIREL